MRTLNRKKRAAAWMLCVLLALAFVPFALAEQDATPGEATCEQHSYQDGVCTVCGDKCSHSNCANESTWNENTRYANPKADGHDKVVDLYGKSVCQTCGYVVDGHKLIQEGATSPENHHYQSGVCIDCKYACTHSYQNGLCTACRMPCFHPEDKCETKTETWDARGYNTLGADGHEFVVREKTTERCTVCGTVVYERTESDVRKTEPHQFSSPIVSCICGALCTHPNSVPGEEYIREKHYLDDSPTKHLYSFGYFKDMTCPDCGDVTPKLVEYRGGEEEHTFGEDDICIHCKAKKRCAHVFEEGSDVCTVCGKRCEHESYQSTAPTRFTNETYADNGDGTHTRKALAEQSIKCLQCGFAGIKQFGEQTFVEDHIYKAGGVCGCGAKSDCKHPNLEEYFTRWDLRDYESLGDGRHKFICNVYLTHHCPDCRIQWVDNELVDTNLEVVEECRYNDQGVCQRCGWEKPDCTHPNAYEFKELDFDTLKVLSKDSERHVYTADVIARTFCPDCRTFYGDRVVQAGAQFSELHEGWMIGTGDERVCELCGYKQACAHEHVVEELWPDQVKKVLSTTLRTHTLLCNAYKDKYCTDCGYSFSSKPVANAEVTKDHNFDENGKCEVCGYQTTCTHENRQFNEWFDMMHEVEALDSERHGFRADKRRMWECPDCGFCGPDEKVADDEYFIEAHQYGSGSRCVVCGMAKPVVTPTPKPTATPRPTPEPEPDEDFVPTPRPATKRTAAPAPVVTPKPVAELTNAPTAAPTAPPAMIDRLVSDIAEAEAAGSDVRIEIAGAKEVLTETEYTELKTLSVQEQVLVTLASIGFEDVVKTAMETMNSVSLSAQAQTLMDSIGERMESATQEEKAALETKLAQYVPVREIEIDGQTYPYFVMELEVEVDGVKVIQRYGFRLDENGEWVFVMITKKDL